ncbi:all-trans retinoic acid-induced differentiation factor isoform X1 [Electrophorus electricus]|uniref:all-trans retinoic acid-induced differentiation factor isoform X1 n=1 Tax=Electrophorus electricus TaxID=8005 RepID=UPI0015D0707B|nr:all-trans retinoic acid-induced differentiation factor isoform X1 [Electrophorus electricus]
MSVSVFKSLDLYIFCILLFFPTVCIGLQNTDSPLCRMCEGVVQNGSAVWKFCFTVGRIQGRCCFKGNLVEDEDSILGLDLSNCSLSHVEDLHEALAAKIICVFGRDLSNNPIFNLSNSTFQGFKHLTHLVLPIKLECPGGNISWDTVEVKHDTRLCEGQRSACNQTGQMPWNCPENSLCMPYGPGFFECSCVHNFHGYKCLRQGRFPMLEVMAILGGSTVIISTLLWVTQRQKVKST